MPFVSGVQKRVVIAKESTWGVLPAPSGGKEIRRVTAEVNLERSSFQSAEITSTAQTSDMRLGSDNIAASLKGELSAGSYSDIMASLLRGTWVAPATTGVLTTIAGASGKFTRSTGSWIIDGFRVGDLVVVSGFTTTGVTNNRNWLVTSLTTTDLNVVDATNSGVTVAVKVAGDSVTVAQVGKKLAIPLTLAARTNDSYTIEEFLSPSNEAYLTTGVKFNSMSLSVQPNQMVTVDFAAMGRTQAENATAGAYFTSPAAPSTSGVFSGNKGVILVGGVQVGVITACSLEVNGNMETSTVIGQRQNADISLGRITVSGEMSVYYEDSTNFYDKFKNETEISIVLQLQADATEWLVIKMPRVRLSSASRDDKEVGNIIQKVGFTALLPLATSTDVERSTIVIQDSNA